LPFHHHASLSKLARHKALQRFSALPDGENSAA